MQKKHSSFFQKNISFIIFLILPTFINNSFGQPPPPPPEDIPTDSGLALLIVIGIIISSYKIYRNEKKKNGKLYSEKINEDELY